MVGLVVAKSPSTYSFNLFSCVLGAGAEEWLGVSFRPVACIAILFMCFVYMP